MVQAATEDRQGRYHLTATSDVGEASSEPAWVVVNDPPAFVRHPAPYTLLAPSLHPYRLLTFCASMRSSSSAQPLGRHSGAVHVSMKTQLAVSQLARSSECISPEAQNVRLGPGTQSVSAVAYDSRAYANSGRHSS